MSVVSGVVPDDTTHSEHMGDGESTYTFTPEITPDTSPHTPATKSVEKKEDEGIKDPRITDVLCGRGGNINCHAGNETFRNMVSDQKKVYLTARFKREKRIIAESIVNGIGKLDPPGRFLSRDQTTGLWHNIGFEKARDKTSQALRENAPTIRKEIEKENKAKREEMDRQEAEEAARATYYYNNPRHPPYHRDAYQTRDDYDGYYRRGERMYEPTIPQRSMSYDNDYDNQYRHSFSQRRTVSYDREDERYYPRDDNRVDQHHKPTLDTRYGQAMDLEPIAEWRNPDIDFRDPKEKERNSRYPPDYDPSSRFSGYSHRDHKMENSHYNYPKPETFNNPSEENHLKRRHDYAEGTTSSPVSSSNEKILHRLPSRKDERRNDDQSLSPTFSRPQKQRDCKQSPKNIRREMKRTNSLWGQLSQSFMDRDDSPFLPICDTSNVQIQTENQNEGIEEEGQEVELFKSLVDSMDCDEDNQDTNQSEGYVDIEHRIPPSPEDQTEWSDKAYGCQSFFSDIAGEAYKIGNGISPTLFPAESMDMDALSIGGQTDRQSSVGSLGGSSLCKVFDNENSLLDVTSPKKEASEKTFLSNGESVVSLHYSQESLHDSGDLLKKLGVDI